MQTIAVQWTTFGPYHAARLTALRDIAADKGLDVLGLETASYDQTYGFSLRRDLRDSVVTVFPDSVFDELSPRVISRGMNRALDRLDPIAVGITSYSYPDARACLEWCKKNGRVAILMTDSKQDAGVRRSWREWIKSRLVSGFDAALVAGEAHRRYLRKLDFPAEAIFDGYDVVDNDHFAVGADDARRDPESVHELPGLMSPIPFFLAAGRMTETKNYDGLLEAYRRYRSLTQDPWRLVIIGDGPLRGQLETLTSSNGIEGVTFAGRRSYAELPAYYGLARALVHAAWVDTWGLVINEAMAARLPILCSTGTGCHEDLVIDGKNGFTFDPGDLDSLAALMIRMSSTDGDLTRMGESSYRIIQEWPVERFASGFLQAFSYGRQRPVSRASMSLRVIMKLLSLGATSPASFHSIKP